MCAGAECHVLLTQTGQLGQTQAGLHGDQKKGVIALSDPSLAIRH